MQGTTGEIAGEIVYQLLRTAKGQAFFAVLAGDWSFICACIKQDAALSEVCIFSSLPTTLA
jgi:hypothetical protein